MTEFGDGLDNMDIESFLNIRTFVEKALEAKGAEITDGGMGAGRADIGFMVEGMPFGIQIRPRSLAKSNEG